MDIQPVTLVGRHVRLAPLVVEHAEALFDEANEPEIWQYMPYGEVATVERLRAVIVDLLGRQTSGADLCFATIHVLTGRPIGMTRFMEVQRANRSVEIGGTWLGRAHRRSVANTESKVLMLRHAFETWGCIRVQIKTDARNERSQRAIERLGLVREGVLRKSIIMPDGFQRSSIYYSMLDDEWPAAKIRLEAILDVGEHNAPH